MRLRFKKKHSLYLLLSSVSTLLVYLWFVLPPSPQSFPSFRSLLRTIQETPGLVDPTLKPLEEAYLQEPDSLEALGKLLVGYSEIATLDESYKRRLSNLTTDYLKIYPKRIEGFHAKALQSLQNGDQKGAAELIEKGLELHPQNEEIATLRIKAQLDLQLGKTASPELLLDLLKKTQDLLKLNAKNGLALEMEGILHFLLQEPDLSKKYFEDRLQLSSENLTSFYYMGLLEMKAHSYDEAKRWFQEVLRHYPNHALSRFKLAQIYTLKEKKYDLAERHLHELLARYKAYLPEELRMTTALMLLHCLFMQNKEDQARQSVLSFQIADKNLTPKDVRWIKKWRMMTQAKQEDLFDHIDALDAIEEQNWDRAIGSFKSYLSRHIDHYATTVYLTALLIKKGSYKEAATYAEKIVTELEFLQPDPTVDDIFFQAPPIDWPTIALLIAGRQKQLDKVTSLATFHAIVQKNIPREKPNAARTLRRLISELSVLDYTWINLGLIYLESGLLAESEKSFQKSLEMNPQNTHALYFLGKLHQKSGKIQKALDFFASIPVDSPIAHKALFEMGNLFIILNKPSEAREMRVKSLKVRPYYTPAWLSLLKGDKS